ncbi:hypothetical protein SLS55_010209 [Diplodia seriata]|uniref:Uncharacterized protein n=1 Tax=Diplodia seriata TaxID=420778 RepID=A0ABR3BY58_9PEZI
MHRWFMARYTSAQPTWKDARNLRDSFLLPYLSVELLKKDPAVFLGLLHNRTHYTPDMWAAFDSKELTIAWAAGFLDVDFNESCVVLHGSQYGHLVPWEADSAHRSDIIGFPRARLVIEAQARLLRFLRRVVDQILEEADLGTPSGSAKFTDMANAGSKKSGNVAYWSQFTYQPFSAPPIFNMDTIVTETKAQLDAAADHLWLLQTQPSYMRRYVRSIQQNAVVKHLLREDAFKIITREVVQDISVVWFWDSVWDEFLHTKSLHNRFRDNIAPGQPLPRKYDEALGGLELILVNAMHHQSKHLGAIIPQRPGFHHNWSFEETPAGLFQMRRKRETPVTELFDADPLEWCLMELQGPPDDQCRLDRAMLFDFLDEHLVQCSAKDRARVDEILFTKLSTYAATSELLSTVRLHRPQNKYRVGADAIRTEDRFAWRFYVQLKERSLKARKTSEALLKHFCDMGPPSGRKDADSLKYFDATYKTLHDFWKSLSTAFREATAAQNLPEDDEERFLGFLAMYENAEHTKGVHAEREQIVREIEASAARPGEASLQAQPSTAAAPAMPEPQHRKTKIKTRPLEPAVDSSPIDIPNDNVTPDEPGTKVTVTHKRSLDVLTAMFPASSGQDALRLVDWDTFVLAMADAGFSARNNGGSAVVFQSDRPGAPVHGGKIIFHKPHPVPKIDPVMLHSMGRRMRRWFDWCRDSFVLDSSQ